MPESAQNVQGRLLEHYAKLIAEEREIDFDLALTLVDSSGPELYAFLARMSENDVAHGYSQRYVDLRALSLAGLADEAEQLEWAGLRAEYVIAEAEQAKLLEESDALDSPEQELPTGDYDKEAPPRVLDASDGEHEQLLKLLWQLRRIQHAKDALDRQREELLDEAVPLQRGLGGPVTVVDPLNGAPLIAGVRQSETLEVNYGLLAKEIGAESAKAVCKAPIVDTKEGGLFHQAVERGDIPLDVVARVSRYKTAKPYIGFSSPVRRK